MIARLLLLVALCPFFLASDAPALVLEGERRLMLSLPSEYLTRPKPARMLRSGLTTTFIFTLRVRSVKDRSFLPQTGARVDVRYEPWDDVYFVTVLHYDGRREKRTLADTDALIGFFANGNLALGSLAGHENNLWSFMVNMKVLPFSEREQQNTRDWFSEKLSDNAKQEDPNKVLDMLLATSIKRRSIISESWRWEVSL